MRVLMTFLASSHDIPWEIHMYLGWIQEGFTAELLRNDSGELSAQ